MRFAEHGPGIPNHLLDARDAGDVVFLCGAGISIPAGLPDFSDLTADVAGRLGVQPDSEAARLIEIGRQGRAAGAATRTREPVSFDRILTLLVRMYGVAQVEAGVVAVLTARRRPVLDNHRALLDLARGPDGRQRIITTNFDRLFQKAQRRLHSYTPPHFLDLSRPDGFDGVVHLHGLIPASGAKRYGDPLGLVLSSGDFGRAYLADAWATRFICDVLDRYIVVLLGYSADDPPVRYLLEGLNLSGRIRESRLYAFAAGESSQIEAEWRERGVTAIAYDPAEHHRHLWDSIHSWAERARDPAAWRNTVVAIAATPPQQLKPFERGKVAALCSSAEGVQAFASAVPPPPADWLCVFDAGCRYWKPGRNVTSGENPSPEIDPLAEYGLDDDPPRPAEPGRNQGPPGIDLLAPLKSDNPVARETSLVTGWRWPMNVNARLFQMARWIRSVMASPATVWWAASRGALHRHLHDQLSWALDHDAAVYDPVVRQAWRLVLEAQETLPNDMRDGWWGVQSQIQNEGWTTRTLREFAAATRPRLAAERPWSYAPLPPDSGSPLKLSRIAHFDVKYPKLMEDIAAVPDASLAVVLEAIRGNLELGAILEAEISQVSERLPTLYPEDKPGEHHHTDSEEYYVTFAQLFRRLAAFDSGAARREYQHWDSPARFFVPLRIWALADSRIVTAAEAGRALRALDRDRFWHHDHARELLWTIRARWPSLSPRDRRALEARIVKGRPKFDYETRAEYTARRASLSAERLMWMRNAGLGLSKTTLACIPALKAGDPRWRDSWAKEADASHESRVGWVRRETAPAPIVDLPLSQVIARCEELATREFQSFTDHDPFSGLVETAPQRALAVLAYEARRKNYPERYWSRLLSNWPKAATARRLVILANTLAKLPAPVLAGVRYELGGWMEAHFLEIDRVDRISGQRCFDHIVDALEQAGPEALKSGLGKSSVGGVEIPSNRMGVDFAINSPTGNLARALINALFAREPKRNQGIAKDLRPRVERLLALPDEGGNHALTIIAEQLHGLYVIDPGWTKAALLQRFDPAQPAAEAAWSGFLSAAQMPSPALFRELKAFFLAAIAASPGWTCHGLTHLGQALVLALEPPPRGKVLLSFSEAREALRRASADVRLETLSFLRGRAAEKGSWEKLIVPFFHNVWPRERMFQTSATTRTLVLFLGELGSRFADGVRLIADFLVPSVDMDVFVFQFGSEREHGHADLTARFPHETLFLLGKVVDETRPHPPYGLADALSRLAEAAPDLRHDERWQRLHRLTLI
jgi:hypothetical protein